MQSVYVINCIEVLVITSIVGECWRFNWNNMSIALICVTKIRTGDDDIRAWTR